MKILEVIQKKKKINLMFLNQLLVKILEIVQNLFLTIKFVWIQLKLCKIIGVLNKVIYQDHYLTVKKISVSNAVINKLEVKKILLKNVLKNVLSKKTKKIKHITNALIVKIQNTQYKLFVQFNSQRNLKNLKKKDVKQISVIYVVLFIL
jgi:hypothetical protein